MHRDQVVPHAERLLELLQPACQEIAVAGSVRRQKAEVHDLEFVLLPKRDMDMFGEEAETFTGLDTRLTHLVQAGVLAWDQDVKRNGPKMKRLILVEQKLVVELYIADHLNYGNLLTIRTGCWEFSRGMMTSRAKGGAMPPDMRQVDGYLHHRGSVVACRTEREYFNAIGLSWYPPEKRTPELAARLWGRRAA
jgi:DNA polymerase/3'-5' exonuclease PolX